MTENIFDELEKRAARMVDGAEDVCAAARVLHDTLARVTGIGGAMREDANHADTLSLTLWALKDYRDKLGVYKPRRTRDKRGPDY